MGQLGSITWREVEPHVVRFRDPMDFQCHLVIGSERALLVDAMGGHGDLRAAVEQVTDLPVTVVATHSHYDHWAGAWFFDVVWMDAAEIDRIPLEMELAAGAHQHVLSKGIVTDDEPWAPRDGSMPEVALLQEGMAFDLGGITVEAIALPGHTVGSMGFYAHELGVLFTGDAVTPTMCLFFPESMDIATHRATLAKIAALPFERFYTSHQDRTFTREDLASFDACAAFVETDPGSEWVHSIFPQFTGRIHIYQGIDPEGDDFRALIEKDTPETRERAKRIRAERRAARAARKAAKQAE